MITKYFVSVMLKYVNNTDSFSLPKAEKTGLILFPWNL